MLGCSGLAGVFGGPLGWWNGGVFGPAGMVGVVELFVMGVVCGVV